MKSTEFSNLILSDEFPWSYNSIEGAVSAPFVQIFHQSMESESIKVNKKVFSAENSSINVERILVWAGDKTAFIVDRVLSQNPVDVKTQFWIKRTNDLKCNVAEKNKLVIRSNGTGAKFFRLLYQADGEDVLKSAGLVLPNGFSNNSEMGLSYYTGMHKFAKEHTVLYGICSDAENRIAAWHFFEQNGFVARPPSQIGGYRIIVSEKSLLIENSQELQDNIKVDI